MEFRGLKINLAELAMVLTALGAFITAWRGQKAAKAKAEKEKAHADSKNPDHG